MARKRRKFAPSLDLAGALGIAAAGVLTAVPARAASLQGPISGWSKGDVPGTVSMYEYVPDPGKLVKNPPILVISHQCGGSAAGIYGWASGMPAAADQYGFVIVYPQTSNNCWDVSSTATQKRYGGGDSQAIVEMVSYEISARGANANRVYAGGISSGAMMTELLLAVYPDVFKAGSEFSGVPAGCANVFDSQGLCGEPAQTAQQWGDRVRAMYPGYSGYRPRVQLWHGTGDTTISYQNQLEAIKEWTNVLGLGTSPTAPSTQLTIGSHTWDHQSWQNSCGYTVLDVWSEPGGPHNTDAPLNEQYVIPFLALDKAGAADPEVAGCADAGASDAGRSADASTEPPDGGNGSGSSQEASVVGDSGATGHGSSSGGSGNSNGGGTGSETDASGFLDGSAASGGELTPASNAGCGCRVRPARGPADARAFIPVALFILIVRTRQRRCWPGRRRRSPSMRSRWS